MRSSLLLIALVIAGALPAPLLAEAPAARVEAEPPPHGCETVGPRGRPLSTRTSTAPSFPPVQLEIRTPFEPTAFPSAGRHYLLYELHLRNFADDPMILQGIEIIGTDAPGAIATFEGEVLASLLRPIGPATLGGEGANAPRLAGGQSAVALVCLAFDRGVAVPDELRHRVLLDNATAQGPAIGTRHTPLRVLAPPVAGADWIAANGPGNHSHHRVGLIVDEGGAHLSRRYAIDWKQTRQGATFSGDALDVRAYHAYGENVFAVADGTVVRSRDGLPDNVPRTAAGFSTALPLTMENIAGNAITLDLGDGQFAYYAHLKAGTLLVKEGDRVQRGQALAQIGNSGDAREPHLHLQVTNTPGLLAAEGLPYVIDRYRAKSANGSWEERANELPLADTLIHFEPVQARRN